MNTKNIVLMLVASLIVSLSADAAKAQILFIKDGKKIRRSDGATRAKCWNAVSYVNEYLEKSGATARTSAHFGAPLNRGRDILAGILPGIQSSGSNWGNIKIRDTHLNTIVFPHEVGHCYDGQHGVNAGGSVIHQYSNGYEYKGPGDKLFHTLMRVSYASSGSKFNGYFSNPAIKVDGVKSGNRKHNCVRRFNELDGTVSRFNNKY